MSFLCFFFSSRRRHTRSLRDWSSDVCSSDLRRDTGPVGVRRPGRHRGFGVRSQGADSPLTRRKGPRNHCRMDPVTVVVSALAAGAATGLTDTVATAVKDAYAGLKRLLTRRYEDVDLAPVEKKPD